MSSPYRDQPIAHDEELTSVSATDRRGFVQAVVITFGPGLVALVCGAHETALTLLIICASSLVMTLLFAVLERPVGAWLDRRYARTVAKGIAELEAKAARV